MRCNHITTIEESYAQGRTDRHLACDKTAGHSGAHLAHHEDLLWFWGQLTKAFPKVANRGNKR